MKDGLEGFKNDIISEVDKKIKNVTVTSDTNTNNPKTETTKANILFVGDSLSRNMNISVIKNVTDHDVKRVEAFNIDNNENHVQKVYNELLLLNREAPGNITWVSQVKKLLESSGFGYIWRNQFVHNENQFLNEFKERIKDMYLQDWSSQVQLTSENRLYKNIKTNFKLEPYLNLNNRALRVSLSKIRLSSHIFNIERGRWGVYFFFI